MRVLPRAVLAAVIIGAASVTTGFGPFGDSGAKDEVAPGRLIGIHHFTLREGVTPAQFERFVLEEWGPAMNNRVPGMQVFFAKGERNASDGEYLAIYHFQSVDTRDHYFPTPDSIAAAYSDLCDQACNDVFTRFQALTEETTYADYVEIAGD